MLRAKTSFDRDNARYLVDLSKLAYSSESNIKSYLNKYHIDFVENAETDTQCFIVTDDKNLIIIFRGSSNLDDWITNFKIDKVRHSFTQHEGFYEAYQSVQSAIFNTASKNKTKNIFIAGHSLGGALASLCAVDLHMLLDTPVTSCYTFGSPRVYDAVSASNINDIMGDRIHRVVNNNDIVTHMPSEKLNFSHIGELAYFEENGTLHVNEDFTWWQKKRYALVGRLDDLFEPGTDGVKDHLISEYDDYV